MLPSLDFLPAPFEWCYIPAGFTDRSWVFSEPENQTLVLDIPSFYMAKYPITVAQYLVYHHETGSTPSSLLKRWLDKVLFNELLHPISDVTWQEAMAFCEWLSHKAGYLITLPTDAQWQRAAQGDDRRKYPWGNEWNSDYCNTVENGINHITPVNQYPQGASPYGVMDMSGNIWEWCLNTYRTGESSLDFKELDLRRQDRVYNIFKGGYCWSPKDAAEIKSSGFVSGGSYQTGIRLVTPYIMS